MEKRYILKLFSSAAVLLFFAMSTFADTMTYYLSEIKVTGSNDTGYEMKLYFDDVYEETSFIQKQTDGLYYVFIPDAAKASKKIKISYKIPKNMPKIELSVEEKPYIKRDSESEYLRIAVLMDDGYALSLTSEKAKNSFQFPFAGFFMFLFAAAIFFGLIFAMRIILKLVKRNSSANCYTLMPRKSESLTDKKSYIEETESFSEVRRRHGHPDSSSFRCFDISDISAPDKRKETRKTPVKHAKKLNLSSLQTNPLTMRNEEVSEFQMPCVNDPEQPQKGKNILRDLNIISALNLTPTKGFFLREDNDLYLLYSYSDGNIHLLKQFKTLTQINLQARFYDQNNKNDIYIVRLDSYKAMIEFSENGMRELAVL